MELLHRLDQTLLLWLNRFAGHSAALDMAVRGIANIYLVKLGLFSAALWWLWFRREDTQGGRRLVVDAIAAVVLAVAASILIQAVMPARPRPLHDAGLPFVPPFGQSREALKNWSSFPSDNAALGFALAATFVRASRPWGLLACLWAALAISLPRVYLGLHYPETSPAVRCWASSAPWRSPGCCRWTAFTGWSPGSRNAGAPGSTAAPSWRSTR